MIIMTEERLKEIGDSIDLQLELSKQLKVDNEMILEEKELYDYAVQLKENIDKTITHLDAFISDTNLSKYDILSILMYAKKLLKGDNKV